MRPFAFCLLAGICLPMIPGDLPSGKDRLHRPRLVATVRLPSSERPELTFRLENHFRQSIKVAIDPSYPNQGVVAFLTIQLYKDNTPLPYDSEIELVAPRKEDVREIPAGGSLQVPIKLSLRYLRKTLKPGEYEVRLKYELTPGSEYAIYWEKELGVTPLAIEESIWLVLEAKK